MRAHIRLESRYSNSSGGSYDEEKSERTVLSREARLKPDLQIWVNAYLHWDAKNAVMGKGRRMKSFMWKQAVFLRIVPLIEAIWTSGHIYKSGIVQLWLTPSPHSKKVLYSNLKGD